MSSWKLIGFFTGSKCTRQQETMYLNNYHWQDLCKTTIFLVTENSAENPWSFHRVSFQNQVFTTSFKITNKYISQVLSKSIVQTIYSSEFD